MAQLDMKHKNIGATVGMIEGMAQLMEGLGGGDALLGEIAELFQLEAQECDHQITTEGPVYCGFNDLNSDTPCCVGECPLGAIVTKEIKDMPASVIEARTKQWQK